MEPRHARSLPLHRPGRRRHRRRPRHRRRHRRRPGRGRCRRRICGPHRGAAARGGRAGRGGRAPGRGGPGRPDRLRPMASLADRACDEFGRLDIVVNNMGGTMPRPLLDTSPGSSSRPSASTCPPRTRCCGRRCPRMLEGGRRVRRQHLVGHGPRGRPRATWPTAPPRARWRSTPAWPPPTWRRASGSTPSRVGLHGHLGARHRDAERRAADGHGGDHPARAHRPARGHRRRHPLPGLAGRRPTSPARSSRSTAASSRPTSTWAPRPLTADLRAPTCSDGTGTSTHDATGSSQWSTGNVGRHALAGIDARPDLELVGLWVSNPDKVGQRRRRAGRAGPHARAWPRPSDVDALLALEPDCIVHTAMADDRLFEALGRPGADPRRRHQRGLLRPGVPAVPLGVVDDPLVDPGHRGRARRPASRSSSTGSTPGSPTTRCRSCCPGSASASRRCAVSEVLNYATYNQPMVLFDIMGFGRPARRRAHAPPARGADHGLGQRRAPDRGGPRGRARPRRPSGTSGCRPPRPSRSTPGPSRRAPPPALHFEVRGMAGGQAVIVLEHVTRLRDDLAPDWPQPAGQGCYRVADHRRAQLHPRPPADGDRRRPQHRRAEGDGHAAGQRGARRGRGAPGPAHRARPPAGQRAGPRHLSRSARAPSRLRPRFRQRERRLARRTGHRVRSMSAGREVR